MQLGGRYRDGGEVSSPVRIALIAMRVTPIFEAPKF